MMSIPTSSVYLYIAVALSLFFVYRLLSKQKIVLVFILLLLLVEASLANRGVFLEITAIPPRFVFLVPPLLILVFILAFHKKSETIIAAIPLKLLVLISIVRIPVELAIHAWYQEGLVPVGMTFEGNNFDILSGFTAIPVAVWLCKPKHAGWLMAWSIFCLVLLVNIVVTAILSVPSPFQVLAFDQPNVAVLKYPGIWLPGFIVPLVLFSHLAIFRKLNDLNKSDT